MPPEQQLTWQDGDLFPPMDQNLPEGDLFMKIRELFPKQSMTPMHMLALVGRNGIGRLGYSLPDHPPRTHFSNVEQKRVVRNGLYPRGIQ